MIDLEKSGKTIIEMKKTCESNPSQWEFKTKDNRYGYIRYRFGIFKICLSIPNGDLDDALNRRPIMEARFGEAYEGSLSDEYMIWLCKIAGFDLSEL